MDDEHLIVACDSVYESQLHGVASLEACASTIKYKKIPLTDICQMTSEFQIPPPRCNPIFRITL